ncbi:MAG: hypothetical protein ACXVCE_14230, partial [Bacteriovorax sp.]
NAYEEGAPRDPTPVGEKTYAQLVGLFKGIHPMDKNSAQIFKENEKTAHAQSREIASVKEEAKNEDKKVEADPKLIEEYKNSLLQKSVSKKLVTNKASTTKVEKKKVTAKKLVIHIYGQTNTSLVAHTTEALTVTKSRAPASVLDQEVPKESSNAFVKEAAPTSPSVASPYSKEYKKQYKESDKLIDDLKKL